ncbi:MAG: phosphoribosylformylglycinamidine synthase subunit PurQ [Thermoplasmatota archaeon]|nr:phosphoribosylformylglycinamidine synthase subunit PurQ [Candidatus Thermoplasmatota archaeon]MBU1913939.1 phosphoribosylformylglycinamidine synthase subunit PurQ [Candidatus Thermoplasmatota archaeon]
MKASQARVCVLRIEGTNCEEEMFLSFKRLGARPEKVHLKQLTGTDVSQEEKRSLFDYHILALPGGFSAGDYVRAGAIMAARMKSRLSKDLVDFIKSGKPVLGVCNGFQILVETGLLPAMSGIMSEYPEAVLGTNDSARFECRPTLLKKVNRGSCVFTSRISPEKISLIPSAHAEGKLMFPLDRSKQIVRELEDNDQIVFKYVDPEGKLAGYPWCPNGATDNIAGICNREGNVFGLMPHPERVFFRFTHPDWTREPDGPGDGRAVFESVMEYVTKKL